MSVDRDLEQRIGRVLTIGVRTSAALLAAGLALSFAGATSVAAWLMTAGLLLLMATPVARVATSMFEYLRHRDWTFSILTAIVLLELCAGVVAALVFHRRL
jgi:uncharacterized membrane protein